MDSMNPQQGEREAHRMQANRDELVERIARAIRADGKVEPVKGLHLNRASSPKEPVYSVSDPSFCVIAQGSKEVFLGNECYLYDPAHYLLITAELPLAGQVIDASKERPYLSLRLELDPALVNSVMVEAGHLSPQKHTDVRAINASALDRRSAGCCGAAGQASGYPYRSALPRAADRAGNRLPAPDGRAG